MTAGLGETYELQPEDLGLHNLRQSQNEGVLISDVDEVNGAGDSFLSFCTNGDGGCGLHAVWGLPAAETKELKLPEGQLIGRRRCCDLLGETLGGREAWWTEWMYFKNIVLSLWNELTVPAATNTNPSAEANAF